MNELKEVLISRIKEYKAEPEDYLALADIFTEEEHKNAEELSNLAIDICFGTDQSLSTMRRILFHQIIGMKNG